MLNDRRILDKAKVGMMRKKDSVFISTILFSMKFHWAPELNPPTAATDGLNLYVHPEFFRGCTPAARIGLLAHECWHVAWNHMSRGMGLDAERYNRAGDFVINNMLVAAGFELPEGGCVDSKYNGMSTRQVYDLLKDEPAPPPQSGEMGSGDIIYDKNKAESKEKQMEIANTIVKAIMRSEMEGDKPGTIPGEIARRIEELIHPKLPWDILLANYMSNFQKEDYSFRKPNRRFMPDFYLPSQYSERLANISVAIDLSGSISEEQLRAFLSEIAYIQDTMRPEAMTILGFDTKIRNVHEIKEGDEILDLEFNGGGGTAITPVLKFFNKSQPTVAILFTDCWFEDYTVTPDFEHIWVVIDNPDHVPRDGEVAHYESTENS